jgi:Tfp pilus assembly protein FimT
MQFQSGISLLEITIIVSILGIIATVAIPGFSASDPHKLALATEEIAQAIRFTRDEAIRTRTTTHFKLLASSQTIRVYKDATSSSSSLAYHPVSKKKYDIQLENHPFATADTISITMTPAGSGSCNSTTNIYFDKSGYTWCNGPANTFLRQTTISVSLAQFSQSITVDGFTGRVAVSSL